MLTPREMSNFDRIEAHETIVTKLSLLSMFERKLHITFEFVNISKPNLRVNDESI